MGTVPEASTQIYRGVIDAPTPRLAAVLAFKDLDGDNPTFTLSRPSLSHHPSCQNLDPRSQRNLRILSGRIPLSVRRYIDHTAKSPACDADRQGYIATVPVGKWKNDNDSIRPRVHRT